MVATVKIMEAPDVPMEAEGPEAEKLLFDLLAAVKLGLATQENRGARPKKSFPDVRPGAPGQLHRGPQTVLHRRLLRVHRAVSELARQGHNVHAPLPPHLLGRLDQVLFSPLLACILPTFAPLRTLCHSLTLPSAKRMTSFPSKPASSGAATSQTLVAKRGMLLNKL